MDLTALGTVGRVELTSEQHRVVDHSGGSLRIGGGPGTGRTTALVARYLRLVASGQPASTVLVVLGNQPAATTFQHAVVPHLSGGFDFLPLTTWFGLAVDLVSRRRGGPLRVLSPNEQHAVVRQLLAEESADDWPRYGTYLGREAFVDEVAAALLAHQTTGAGIDELSRFAARYRALLAGRGQVDAAGLLSEAATVAASRHYDHVLVDDHDGGQSGADRLLDAVAGEHTVLTLVGDEPDARARTVVALTQGFRHPAPPVLVTCPHPSTESEAVAGELLAARAEGVAWSEMAVLVRGPGGRSRAVARALARHDVPVAPAPGLGPGTPDPLVLSILDLLEWSSGGEAALDRLLVTPMSHLGAAGLRSLRDDVVAAAAAGARPADLAFMAWERGLGHLIGGDDGNDCSLDAVVAFLERLDRSTGELPTVADLLARRDELANVPARRRGGPAADAVTITSISAAAGREWDTVVVVGCVEGEMPRVGGRRALFDDAAPPTTELRHRSLTRERDLFRTACSRATGRLVATAAPQPGVLLSRFVEAWPRREARAPLRLGPLPPARRETANDIAVFPDGALVLSASQLSTYDDCPLRYAYEYGLRVRDEAGAPAALGSLVHDVLAEFLRPDRPADRGPRSRDELFALAAERWTDDIARYRPQVEECRRDYFAMLDQWWAAEGEGPAAPEVLAVERRFEIEVGGGTTGESVRLVGFIDRVDRVGGDDGDGIRIVDYKTGRNELRPDAMADDLRLAVYHLAATLDPELVAFGPPRRLQLLYLRTMHRFAQPIVEGHAAATEDRVLAAAAAIRAEQFEPSVDASCRTCPFHRLCPLQPEGREVGAA